MDRKEVIFGPLEVGFTEFTERIPSSKFWNKRLFVKRMIFFLPSTLSYLSCLIATGKLVCRHVQLIALPQFRKFSFWWGRIMSGSFLLQFIMADYLQLLKAAVGAELVAAWCFRVVWSFWTCGVYLLQKCVSRELTAHSRTIHEKWRGAYQC